MTRWSQQELANHLQQHRRPIDSTRPINPKAKFKNIRVERNGQKFDSKLEYGRWVQLEQMRDIGVISDLRAQVSFPLMVGEHLVGLYVADATYTDVKTGTKVVEDSKGVLTALFKWKRKHFRAQYGFDITVVTKR